jgi:outer membrane protein W
MKKMILIAAALLTIGAGQLNAQYISLGPVAGFGQNQVTNLGGNIHFMPSGYLGLGMIYAKNVHWGWGAQLTAASEGYKVDGTDGTSATVTPLYVRLTPRAYYFFGNANSVVRPKIYLGPTVAAKVAESTNYSYGLVGDMYMLNSTGSFRTFDVGVNGGAGVNIRLMKATWLNLDAGYTQGLMDAVKDPAGRYNMNENLALNVGLLFGLK